MVAVTTTNCNGSHQTTVQDAVEQTRSAIVRLEVPGRICTAFHIGNGVFITAAHCLDHQELIFLRQPNDRLYIATPVMVDEDRDLASLQIKGTFDGGKLEIWSGESPRLGTQILAMGFPGYYDTNLIFEIGWLKDFTVYKNIKMLLSSEMGYPGESGGPIVDVESGLVIGVNDLMNEQVEMLNSEKEEKPAQRSSKNNPKIPSHFHQTLSMFVGFPELWEVILKTQEKIRQNQEMRDAIAQ